MGGQKKKSSDPALESPIERSVSAIHRNLMYLPGTEIKSELRAQAAGKEMSLATGPE
jgi:hypothetical protein